MLLSHETDQTTWSHDFLETMLPIIHNVLFFLIEVKNKYPCYLVHHTMKDNLIFALQAEDMSIRDGAASYISSLIKHITPQGN